MSEGMYTFDLSGLSRRGDTMARAFNISDYFVTEREMQIYKVPADIRQDSISFALAEEVRQRKERQELERRRAMLDEYLAAFESAEIPDAPRPVFTFSRIFKGSDIEFRYAAILASNDKWYLTGGDPRTPQGVSWEDLALWMVSGDYPVPYSEITWLRADS